MDHSPVTPTIRFVDLDEAVGFYRDRLGFKVERGDVQQGNIAISFEGLEIMLEGTRDFYGETYNTAIKNRIGQQSPNALYIETDDVDGLYRQYQEENLRIIDPVADRPWGQREFTVEDHLGNWLTFWQMLPE
ncbi:MAG TPA: VOC family protein [Acidimicrobiia bacterium]|jgi:uncharacterized glyoxalase superfamily protein PhnB